MRLPVRTRQAHRGVEVVSAGQESPFEDAHHEPRVDHVEHVGDLVLPACLRHGFKGDGGVDLDRAEPVVADARDQCRGPVTVVVADDDARRSRGGRR